MTLAALLVLYSLTIGVLGPPVLGRLSRGGVAPRLALAAWGGAISAVLLAWVLATVLIVRAGLLADRDMQELMADCIHTVKLMVIGEHGPIPQAAVLAVAALSVLAVGLLTGRLAMALGRTRIRTHRHCRLARLMADPSPGPEGSVVLDAAERVVYCVVGKPPAIVITRGALDVLDDAQLAAVLAHERAHLSGRHHLAVAASRAVASALPWMLLFRNGATAIANLVEMRADDVATRRHPGSTLVAALLALSDIGPLPRSVLAANGVGVVDRVERLLNPRDPVRAAPLRLALVALTLAVLVPVAVAGALTLDPSLCPFPLL
jgi:Zn-dependent protease with chaperone function